MLFSTCPCCSNTLLRHIRAKEIYWFCRHCYLEMPYYDRILETTANVRDSRGLTQVSSLRQKILALR